MQEDESKTGGHITQGAEPASDFASVGEKKIDWVEKAIEYEATPKRLREPKEKGEFIKSLGVPRSTYYREVSKNENVAKMIELCFKQAKFRTPEIIDKLGQKAETGNDASIGQFMEYVLEIKKKLELSGDKDNPIPILFHAIPKHDGSSENTEAKEET